MLCSEVQCWKKTIKPNAKHCISISGCSLHSPLPNAQTLVVRRADKPAVLVDTGDGVDGPQVTVVLLNHLTGPDVPLTRHKAQRAEQVNTFSYTCVALIYQNKQLFFLQRKSYGRAVGDSLRSSLKLC